MGGIVDSIKADRLVVDMVKESGDAAWETVPIKTLLVNDTTFTEAVTAGAATSSIDINALIDNITEAVEDGTAPESSVITTEIAGMDMDLDHWDVLQ